MVFVEPIIVINRGPLFYKANAFIFYPYNKQCWLLGDHLLLRDFRPYGIIFTNVCYNRCHDNAVKGFWALWNNIYDSVCLLL
jgi:hypothetical protein